MLERCQVCLWQEVESICQLENESTIVFNWLRLGFVIVTKLQDRLDIIFKWRNFPKAGHSHSAINPLPACYSGRGQTMLNLNAYL